MLNVIMLWIIRPNDADNSFTLSVLMPCVVMLSVVILSVVMLSVVMLNVIMLSVIMLKVIMLSVLMLGVVKLSVIMLSVIMIKWHYAECHGAIYYIIIISGSHFVRHTFQSKSLCHLVILLSASVILPASHSAGAWHAVDHLPCA